MQKRANNPGLSSDDIQRRTKRQHCRVGDTGQISGLSYRVKQVKIPSYHGKVFQKQPVLFTGKW